MKVTVEKGIQIEKFQHGNIMDKEIDELWHLKQRCKRNNDNEVQTIIWMIVEDCEDHCRVDEQQQLQSKMWDPGGLKVKIT